MEFLSPERQKELEKELDYLVKVKRKEISQSLSESSSFGDLSENAEYHEAKEEQLRNEQRITGIVDLLSHAVVVSDSCKKRSNVEVGCFVLLKRFQNNLEEKYQIVGSGDVDPFAGKISYESPLGSALLGKKKGHTVGVLTPKGEMRYTVIDIM
ncbi:MAG: transcription elongation factor GreA [Candidatus Tagabacteria bacterium CG09_land_8_20_14_0_10_41_14]|uniref:Transcription elongation factor GreA n=2 Tax=Candidatus Tagaibacteriota TaxID=1817918 RepID=A0A2H0WL08_9BACT|nr:MAG: transcription elongation factor GreA [Candidatus Tagabacteria bacterium CG09_land_8_20_14_0_10_41_14]PJE73384.1 MAG: transcription elongation factor GreA [Candidatus Tagabacteria bacterium CG10_big_fil_rev_8_21_14_0_10_40_13]